MARQVRIKQVVSTPTGANTYYASGAAQITPSGAMQLDASFSVSGPWREEKQGMLVEYERVPTGYYLSSNVDSLSATPSVMHKIDGTHLKCTVTAYHTVKQTYTYHNVSSMNASQKFEVIAASADAQGLAYGDITASTLGPMGKINSIRPAYSQRQWKEGIDVEIDEYMEGVNFYLTKQTHLIDKLADGNLSPDVNANQKDYVSDFKYSFIPTTKAGSFMPSYDGYLMDLKDLNKLYQIDGAYTTDAEALTLIFRFIDQLGIAVAKSRYIESPPSLTDLAHGQEITKIGCPSYNINLHDYTLIG